MKVSPRNQRKILKIPKISILRFISNLFPRIHVHAITYKTAPISQQKRNHHPSQITVKQLTEQAHYWH